MEGMHEGRWREGRERGDERRKGGYTCTDKKHQAESALKVSCPVKTCSRWPACRGDSMVLLLCQPDHTHLRWLHHIDRWRTRTQHAIESSHEEQKPCMVALGPAVPPAWCCTRLSMLKLG
jgi:hypothetical protein